MQTYFRREKRAAIARLCIEITAITDFLCAAAAFVVANHIRFKYLPFASSEPSPLKLGIVIGCASFLFVVLILVLDGYRRHVMLRYRRSFPVIYKATLIWFITFPSLCLFMEVIPWISRVFIILGAILILGFVSLGRLIIQRFLLARGFTGAFRQQILFIDWTPQVAHLVKAVKKDPWHPYEIIGIVPPPSNKFTTPPVTKLPILGSYEEITHFFEKGLVNIVIVADGKCRDKELAGIAELCEKNLVTFMILPSGFQILLSGLKITTVSSVPLLGVTELPLERPTNLFIKRVIDLVGCIFGLILFTPLIAIFSLLVYLESPGPVFYRQVRVGQKGKLFKIIKIRSMKLDAEKESGPRWATQNDDRRLRIGAFMRRWNIDELPQFWNVLKGEMSLVGPRPERPELIPEFKDNISHYNARHTAIPGITGWAQVSGLRGDTDLSERIRYDLYYMENWSPALDIQIMLMTFFKWEGAA
jgi:exopolysaccharide biosynthesis polyprenyl glycosylphosphotransferase